MPVCEQAYKDGVLQQTRVNFLGARGIEAVVTVDHTRGNAVALRWLLYDGHGNLVRLMAPDYTLSAFQWRGVWGEGQGSLGAGRGYCANLGHPEDETGLVYMRARYYEPATGRFISEDPDRDGVNWYAYCESKPVIYVDPDGRQMTQEQRDVLANEMIRAGRSLIVSGFIAALSGAITLILLGIAARAGAIPIATMRASALVAIGTIAAGLFAMFAGAYLMRAGWLALGLTEAEWEDPTEPMWIYLEASLALLANKP
jgi:RHS repeat-associated protein